MDVILEGQAARRRHALEERVQVCQCLGIGKAAGAWLGIEWCMVLCAWIHLGC